MNEQDCTFCISPGGKTRYIAGPFDTSSRTPRYEIEVSVPKHVRSQVEVNQFLLGTPEDCQWAYDIKNRSTWPVLVIIKRDGNKL